MVKPFLSNKIISNEKITIVKGDKIIKTDKGTAKVLNNFLFNIASHLNIPPSTVIAVKKKCTSRSHFNFSFVENEAIFKKITLI